MRIKVCHIANHSPTRITPPIVNGTSIGALCLLSAASARTDWPNPARRQDNVCFCCLPGEVPLVLKQGPATATDTKFRGCQSLPGAAQHLPVAAHQS